MAELQKIKCVVEEFLKEYFLQNSQAEENRQKETQAATEIQSWFRACKVRAYLSHLHKKAVIIQKIWRGFTTRARVRQMVKIQRQWRGFFVRKYVHNFYARKSYMERLIIKNHLIRRELDEIEELQIRKRECVEMVKEQTAKISQARRLHHLLSTKQCPGVFNSPFRPAPHEMELMLRQVKYQTPTRLVPRDRACLLRIPGSAAPSFSGTPKSPWIKSTKTCGSRPILPPIASKKQQGEFREPGELWEQHLRCPDLMMSLQTSYTHLEEIQRQLRHHQSVRLPSVVQGTGSVLHHMSHSSPSFK
ncbi:spermatogenesis-associated protein 17 isoform X2 [Melanotaenia boesemani]|uniref:spermatogenesis-associated protein 17 isoform X2 n=1 Tax=Melanotaenia boesemani TaxID=1250792 RepID=UPI001C04D4D8|nr:spermatogenesis-associated protein 17 isoform X2 [Melanotaenia boesemani]